MYKNSISLNFILFFLIYECGNGQQNKPNCILQEGLLMISTGQVVGTDIYLTAVFNFPHLNDPHNIYATTLYSKVNSSKAVGTDIVLFEIDLQGYQEDICDNNGCSLIANQGNPQVGILFDIEYYITGIDNRFIRAPIISLRYQNFQPDYNLTDDSCYYNQTIHHDSVKYNFSAVNVTDCYCCPKTTRINCPNLAGIPPEVLPNVTLGTGSTTTASIKSSPTIQTSPTISSENKTTSTPMPTSFPQPNCTNPTDPIIIAYCDLKNNETKGPPGEIANNITNSLTPSNLTGYDIFVLSQIMHDLSNTKNLTQSDFHGISRMTDVILDAPSDSFENSNDGESGSTLVMLKSIYYLMQNSPNNVSFLNGSNLGLSSFKIDCKAAGGDTIMGDESGQFSTFSNIEADASISIPTNIISARRLFYCIYRNTKLFVGNSSNPGNAIPKNFQACKQAYRYDNSKVLTGTLLDDNSTPPYLGSQTIEANGVKQKIVTVKYSKKKTLRPLHGTMKLTWWTGYLWSNQTCSVTDDGDFWVSECDHLTDFTLIVDGLQKDPCLCNNGLIAISYIVYIGSIISLIILNLIFILQKISYFQVPFLYGQRQNINLFTFIYNMELLTFYILFGLFSDEDHTIGITGCHAVAIISYWLLISCITMTIFQAWKILKAFSWSSVSEKLMIWLTNKILIIVTAIGIPTLMALISGLVVKDFYNREDGFCWIRPDYVIFGVILPLTLLVANGIFCFVVALLRLFPKICGIALIRTASSTIGKRPKKKEKLVALIIMQFILGIPWILQYLTLFTSYATVWHYLFTIVNGSQGIILLFIYLYKSYKHYTHQKYKVNRELEISNAKIETETPSSHIKRIRSFTTETNVVNGMSPRVPKHKNEGMNLEVPQVKYENMKNLEFDNNNF